MFGDIQVLKFTLVSVSKSFMNIYFYIVLVCAKPDIAVFFIYFRAVPSVAGFNIHKSFQFDAQFA